MTIFSRGGRKGIVRQEKIENKENAHKPPVKCQWAYYAVFHFNMMNDNNFGMINDYNFDMKNDKF